MKLKALLITLLALPLIALAGVNPKNGSFYITYLDVWLKKDGQALEIRRTYNSLSTEVGWFGYGWGSLFESRLTVLPDGSAVVREVGVGKRSFYRSKNESAIKTGVQRIVDVATQKDQLTPAAAEQLAAQLLRDEELRVKKVIHYGIQTELALGVALDDACGTATLTRVAQGYRRLHCKGVGASQSATDTFDMQGRLVKHALDDGYAVTIRYTEGGTAEIRDTLGQTITLSWTPEGRVASAKTSSGQAQYTYEGQNLVRSESHEGNAYRYSYDKQHNLTRIDYTDTSSMVITYSATLNGAAESVTDRNGEQHTYAYRSDPANPNRYWTNHTFRAPGGQPISREYEFEHQTSPTGVTQLTRTAMTEGTRSQENKYDNQGRVVGKTDASGKPIEYVYHPRSGKLILVFTSTLNSEFHYDGKGELVRAENSEGQVIHIDYANSAHIQRVVQINRAERTRRELLFKYNPAGRPTEITLVGAGKVNVEYDDKGEISKVNSAQGPKMALQITQIFQAVLSAVSVAGAKS